MEMVSKPCQDRFLHPIMVHSIIEKKENIGSQMGQTKKNFKNPSKNDVTMIQQTNRSNINKGEIHLRFIDIKKIKEVNNFKILKDGQKYNFTFYWESIL